MQFDYQAVSSVLRKIRRKKGLSQEVVSGLAGIARTHLTMIETGSKQPNLETFWKLAQALDISASQLMILVEQEIAKEDSCTQNYPRKI